MHRRWLLPTPSTETRLIVNAILSRLADLGVSLTEDEAASLLAEQKRLTAVKASFRRSHHARARPPISAFSGKP